MSKPILSDDKDQPKNLLEELQNSLIRRFSRVPLSHGPIVYEFTNDRALLHQYYRLREIMYRKVFKTDKFMGEEDVHDKISHILIARRGKLCIGGCRLTIREADENFLLPMETPDFKLRSIFPNLPLRKLCHGEFSRFAIIDEDEDKMEIMLAMSRLMIEKCVNSELGFVFLKSNLLMAHNWRKIIHNHCGQKNVRICREIKVPEIPIHPEITWYITEVPLPAAEITHYEKDALVRPIESLVH